MAEEAVDHAAILARLDDKPCITRNLKIHGHREHAREAGHLNVYGSDVDAIHELVSKDMALAERLSQALPYTCAEVVWATRYEMARSPEDVLARRTRALFLNAAAALEMAPKVAEIMAAELQKDSQWVRDELSRFENLCKTFMPAGASAQRNIDEA